MPFFPFFMKFFFIPSSSCALLPRELFFFSFFLPRVERIAVIAQPVGYRCPRHNGEEVEEPSLGRFHPPRMAKKRKKVCPALLLRRPLHAKRGPSTPLPSPQQKKEKKNPQKYKKKKKKKNRRRVRQQRAAEVADR